MQNFFRLESSNDRFDQCSGPATKRVLAMHSDRKSDCRNPGDLQQSPKNSPPVGISSLRRRLDLPGDLRHTLPGCADDRYHISVDIREFWNRRASLEIFRLRLRQRVHLVLLGGCSFGHRGSRPLRDHGCAHPVYRHPLSSAGILAASAACRSRTDSLVNVGAYCLPWSNPERTIQQDSHRHPCNATVAAQSCYSLDGGLAAANDGHVGCTVRACRTYPRATVAPWTEVRGLAEEQQRLDDGRRTGISAICSCICDSFLTDRRRQLQTQPVVPECGYGNFRPVDLCRANFADFIFCYLGAFQTLVTLFSAPAFMEYRNPLGSGPSGKTCPRRASQVSLIPRSIRLRKSR
jgi:hypothetical protein